MGTGNIWVHLISHSNQVGEVLKVPGRNGQYRRLVLELEVSKNCNCDYGLPGVPKSYTVSKGMN